MELLLMGAFGKCSNHSGRFRFILPPMRTQEDQTRDGHGTRGRYHEEARLVSILHQDWELCLDSPWGLPPGAKATCCAIAHTAAWPEDLKLELRKSGPCGLSSRCEERGKLQHTLLLQPNLWSPSPSSYGCAQRRLLPRGSK